MRLILSGDRPRNSDYSTESGQILYKVDKPSNVLTEGTATIRKLDGPYPGHFPFYAQVEFHSIRSTRIRFNGFDLSEDDYFRKGKWSWSISDRIFRASDGYEYRWKLDGSHIKMVRNDGSKFEVVEFRESKHGYFSTARPASLEIHPSVEHILDEIILTFIYCHKLRKDDKETREAIAAGAG
ncbi:hypothetical protein AN958_02251 [Leucoagaricus sp. SymC.cos]|nr:hypothetical protein AN958_02251 [Leucoagaricus sp. SymC.cos]